MFFTGIYVINEPFRFSKMNFVFVIPLCALTFALAEVQLQDGLHQRVGVEGQIKLRTHFWLQGPLHPLVLRGCHPLDESVRNLQLCGGSDMRNRETETQNSSIYMVPRALIPFQNNSRPSAPGSAPFVWDRYTV